MLHDSNSFLIASLREEANKIPLGKASKNKWWWSGHQSKLRAGQVILSNNHQLSRISTERLLSVLSLISQCFKFTSYICKSFWLWAGHREFRIPTSTMPTVLAFSSPTVSEPGQCLYAASRIILVQPRIRGYKIYTTGMKHERSYN